MVHRLVEIAVNPPKPGLIFRRSKFRTASSVALQRKSPRVYSLIGDLREGRRRRKPRAALSIRGAVFSQASNSVTSDQSSAHPYSTMTLEKLIGNIESQSATWRPRRLPLDSLRKIATHRLRTCQFELSLSNQSVFASISSNSKAIWIGGEGEE